MPVVLVEILIPLVAALMSMLAGGIAKRAFFEGVLRDLFKWRTPAESEGHGDRLESLLESLKTSSAEIDKVIAEISSVAQARRGAVASLEQQLGQLEGKEREMKERITVLENVPIPVAEYLADVARAGEKRGARRDYTLFGAGVLVSTFLSILFFILQGAP